MIKNKKVGTLEETLRRKGEACQESIGELEEAGSEDDLDAPSSETLIGKKQGDYKNKVKLYPQFTGHL